MRKRICMVLLASVLFTITACGNSEEKRNVNAEPEISMSQPDPNSEEVEEYESKTETVQKSETQTEVQPTEAVRDNAEQEVTDMKMKVQVGESVYTASLADNSSVDALRELMADGSLTLNMSDYANMEKGADLGVTLPQNNEQMNTQAGDIILYQGRTLAIYYDTNSWSLTPIGKIDDVDAEELRETLGTGDVTVTLSLE